MSRNFSVHVHESISVSDSVSSTHGRNGNKGSTAELDSANQIRAKLVGRSPRQEEDSLDTCKRLVRVLNARGAAWTEPIEGKADADGESVDPTDRKKKLAIQVVRASNDEAMWRTLTQRQEVAVQVDADALADELIGVIKKKRDTYPDRATLTLAVDASRLPAYTFDAVLERFRQRHRTTCASCTFREVWLVGPRDELVFRLDA